MAQDADATSTPDAALLALCEAWHDENRITLDLASTEARDEPAVTALIEQMSICRALLTRIERIPAATLDGLAAKFAISAELLAENADIDAAFVRATLQEFVAFAGRRVP